MATETAGVLERLATFLTHIWTLTCVLAKMVLVVGAPLKCQRTVGALKRPDSRVDLEELTVTVF